MRQNLIPSTPLQARALDKLPIGSRGLLHVIAVGVADVMNTKDIPTTYEFPLYEGRRPNADATGVAILRAAGAPIIGKTAITEFAVPNFGPWSTNPRNPRNPKHTPGGASCGSTAAVADLHVPISLGCQNSGSLIRPASFTDLFALKQTNNALSTDGVRICFTTLDTVGFLARSIDDLQLLADVCKIPSWTIPQTSSRKISRCISTGARCGIRRDWSQQMLCRKPSHF